MEKLATYNNNSSLPDVVVPKILLAEDDLSIRRLIEITLQKAGYEVTSAEDGLAALQFALSNHFDAVIADAIMPNLSGYDLCRILRQHSSYNNTPFILLSGMENRVDPEGKHISVFIQKGTDLMTQILETLSSFLSREIFT